MTEPGGKPASKMPELEPAPDDPLVAPLLVPLVAPLLVPLVAPLLVPLVTPLPTPLAAPLPVPLVAPLVETVPDALMPLAAPLVAPLGLVPLALAPELCPAAPLVLPEVD